MLIKSKLKIYTSILVFSLLFGVFFEPFQAKAGFFSDIFANPVSADTKILEETQNSQNMALLQANVFSAIDSDNKKDNKVEKIDESEQVNIVSDNALLPSVSSMANNSDLVGEDGEILSETQVYVVKKGDTIPQIAEMFKVSSKTIYWMNDMKPGDKIKEGDILLILEIDGTKHTVIKGETLEKIAKKYDVSVFDITSFNDLPEKVQLVVGQELIIPGGITDSLETTSSTSSTKTNSSSKNSSQVALKDPKGFFIHPLPGSIKTRGIINKKGVRKHNGADFGAPTGTPIRAAAGGTVIAARGGYNGGMGTMVIIQHSNGTRSTYGHMSKLGTQVGAKVSQGETIGYVGSTGRSTGPHLHFETSPRIYDNPWK